MNLQVDTTSSNTLQKPISFGTKRTATSSVQLSPSETCTKVSSHAVFKLGDHAAVTVPRLGLVSGFVPGLNLLIESPFLHVEFTCSTASTNLIRSPIRSTNEVL